MTAPLYDQDSFRGRNDDGSESAATWKANANTNFSQVVGTTFRLRFLIQNTNSRAGTSISWQLQYNKNSGGWTNVTGSSSNVKVVDSTNLTDGADCTQQIGAGTFLTDNNGICDGDGIAGPSSPASGNELEVEYSLQIVATDVANNDTIQLRVTQSGTALNTYTNTPTVTVIKGTERQFSATLSPTTTTPGLDPSVEHRLDVSLAPTTTTPGLDATIQHQFSASLPVVTVTPGLDLQIDHNLTATLAPVTVTSAPSMTLAISFAPSLTPSTVTSAPDIAIERRLTVSLAPSTVTPDLTPTLEHRLGVTLTPVTVTAGLDITVSHPLTVSLPVTTVTPAPSMAIERRLAVTIAPVTVTSGIDATVSHQFTAAIAPVTVTPGLDMMIERRFAPNIPVTTTTPTPSIIVSHVFSPNLAPVTVTSAIDLAIERRLTAVISPVTVTATLTPTVEHRLGVTLAPVAVTPGLDITVSHPLTVNLPVTTVTPAPNMAIERRLVVTIAPVSITSTPDTVVSHQFTAVIAPVTVTAGIDMALERHLAPNIAVTTTTATPDITVSHIFAPNLAPVTVTPAVNLAVEHRLTAASSPVTVTSSPTATVEHRLSAANSVTTTTAAPDITITHVFTGSLATTTTTAAPDIIVSHPLSATLAPTTTTSAPTIIVSHPFTAALTPTTTTSTPNMMIQASFSPSLATTTTTSAPSMQLEKRFAATLASVFVTSAISASIEHQLGVTLAVTAATSAPDLSLTTMSAVTVSTPGGTLGGHVLIAVIGYAGTPTLTADGWTNILTRAATGVTLVILRRIAVPNEPTSHTFSLNTTNALSAAILSLGSVNPYAIVDVSASQANASSTNVVAPTVTTTSTNERLIFAAAWANNYRATPPGGMSEHIDVGAGTVGIYAASETRATAGATGTRTATLTNAAASAAALIAIKPAKSLGSYSGYVPAGYTVAAKSIIPDYGVSGMGYHEINAVDGLWGANAPYNQTVSWATHPSLKTVNTRLGNLRGIFGAGNEYGLYAGDGSIADSAKYIRVSNLGIVAHNVPIQMYNGATVTVSINAWNDVWLGPSSGDKRLSWNGTTLTVKGAIVVQSGSSGIATFTDAGTLATQSSVTWQTQVTGTGKPADNATVGATWGTNLYSLPTRFGDSPSAAGLYLTASYLGYYNGSAWRTMLANTGEFYFGGSSGAHLEWDGSQLKGIDSGSVTQWYADAGTGKLYAGAGSVTLDSTGVSVKADVYTNIVDVPEPPLVPTFTPTTTRYLALKDPAAIWNNDVPTPGGQSYNYAGGEVGRLYSWVEHIVPAGMDEATWWTHRSWLVLEAREPTLPSGTGTWGNSQLHLKADIVYLNGITKANAFQTSSTNFTFNAPVVVTGNITPGAGDTYDIGAVANRWNKLYVKDLFYDTASGTSLSGSTWAYNTGDMYIQSSHTAARTLYIQNPGAGTMNVDIEGNIILTGTVDGVDVSTLSSNYTSHASNANAHHNQSHVLATTSGLGSDHTVSGLTAGFVLRASGAAAAAFAQLAHSDLSGIGANDHHAQSHVLASTSGLGADHTVSGLTAGFVLRASGAAAAAFAQLSHSDLGGVSADQHHAQSHVLATTSGLGADHSTSGLTAGQVLRASGATTAAFASIQDADLPSTIVRTTRTLTAGNGFTVGSGGDLSANRTFTIGAGSGITVNANDVALAWGTPTISTILPDDAASAGSGANPARSDHKHAIATAAPGSNSVNLAASVEGSGNNFARADHTHQLDVSIAPTWTGTHTFSPTGVTPPPFAIGVNSQGVTVTGLRADTLNRTVTAGNGLTGGGALTADITLNVTAGTLITVGTDTVGITDGANYQFIGTGGALAAGWRNVSELAGAGMTATNGVLNVIAGTLISVAADSVGLSNGTAQYQVPVTGSTPFTPAWTDLSTYAGDGISWATNVYSIELSATSGLELTGATPGKTLQLADTIAGNGLTIASKVLAVGAGTMMTVAADTIGISTGATYQFIGTGSGTSAQWVNLSTLAGAGMTHTNGVLDIGAGTLMTIGTDTISLSVGTAQYQVIVTGANPYTPAYTLLSTFAGDGLEWNSGTFRVGAGNLITIATDTVSVSNGTAQYQVPVTGSTPFPPVWTALSTYAGTGINFTSNVFNLDTPGTLTVSTNNNASVDAHTHAITSLADVGTTPQAVILSSTSGGGLRLELLTVDTSITFGSDVTLTWLSSNVLGLGSDDSYRSNTYTSGLAGWNITGTGDAEFNNVDIRGSLKVTILQYGVVQSTNGSIWITYSAGKLNANATSVDSPTTFNLDIEDPDGITHATAGGLWNVGDVLRLKEAAPGVVVQDLWVTVSTKTDMTTYWRLAVVKQSPAAGTNYTFYKGAAVMNYGASGKGYIQLTADATNAPYIQMATHAGSPWTTQTPRTRFGNLNGSYGYGADTWGFGAGQYGTDSSAWLTADDTNGIRIGRNTTVRGQWDTSGNVFIGDSSAYHTKVSATGVEIKSGATTYTSVTTSAVTLGLTTQEHVLIDSTSIKVKDNTTVYAEYGATTTIGATSGEHVAITSTTVQLKEGANVHVSLSSAALTLGLTSSGEYIDVSATNGFRVYSNALLVGQWDNAGNITIGETASSRTRWYITSSAATLYSRTAGGIDKTIFSVDATPVITLGHSGDGEYITIDNTNGIQIYGGGSVINQMDASGNVFVGLQTGWHTKASATGVEIKNSGTVYATYGTAITIGQVALSQDNIYISAGALEIRNNMTVRIRLAADGSGYLANSSIAWDTSGNLTVTGNATIAGWTVANGYFVKDTGVAATSSGMAPADYPFYAGQTYANRATAPFRVTPAGAITATSGAIGGWTLSATSLTAGSGATTIGLDTGGTNPAFYAGSATPASAPFRVTNAGVLTATNATITGTITATSGSITGTLNLTGSGVLNAGQVSLDTTGIRIVTPTYFVTNDGIRFTDSTYTPGGIWARKVGTAPELSAYYQIRLASNVDPGTESISHSQMTGKVNIETWGGATYDSIITLEAKRTTTERIIIQQGANVSPGVFITASALQFNGYTVWHAGNDGTTSTLDADLLDAQHGSYYLNAGNLTGTLADARLPTTMSAKTFSGQITSSVTTGTAPFSIASTTVVANLNAAMCDGVAGANFLRSDVTDTAAGVITFTNGWDSNAACYLDVAPAAVGAYFRSNVAADAVNTTRDAPLITWRGYYWNGSSVAIDASLNLDITAVTPTYKFTFDLGGVERMSIDNSGLVVATRFQSTQTTGTAPFTVASTTLVSNLNAQYLNGNASTAFAAASHNHSGANITSGTVADTYLPATMASKTINGLTMQSGGVTMATVVSGGIRIDSTATDPNFYVQEQDNGASYGGRVVIGRNTNASTPASGAIQYMDKSGTWYFLWPDDNGTLRIGTSANTSANDTSGNIVGTQTSNLAFKTVVATPTPSAGYNAVREAAAAVRDFFYTDHRNPNQDFTGPKIQRGIIVNYAPQFGYDYHPDYPDGRSLDVVTALGNLCLATSYLGDLIETQDQKITRLEHRIAHLEARLNERN